MESVSRRRILNAGKLSGSNYDEDGENRVYPSQAAWNVITAKRATPLDIDHSVQPPHLWCGH